jgi:transposase-like protein
MGQVLHDCATTTEAIRRAIQNSQESLRALAKRHGINPKSVAKWRKRGSVADLPTGPKDPKSTSLSVEDEARYGAGRSPGRDLRISRAMGVTLKVKASVCLSQPPIAKTLPPTFQTCEPPHCTT